MFSRCSLGWTQCQGRAGDQDLRWSIVHSVQLNWRASESAGLGAVVDLEEFLRGFMVLV